MEPVAETAFEKARRENVDVFDRMIRDGDDLSAPRLIDFQLVFPDASAAAAFVGSATALGFSCQIDEARCVADLPWDVTASCVMLPDIDEVTAMELRLDALAQESGGRIDGWGCLRLA